MVYGTIERERPRIFRFRSEFPKKSLAADDEAGVLCLAYENVSLKCLYGKLHLASLVCDHRCRSLNLGTNRRWLEMLYADAAAYGRLAVAT